MNEIHRFNKAQQDAFLHAVESGEIIIVGATTENPSFEVNPALLSRCQVYRLLPLKDKDIVKVINQALEKDAILSKHNIEIESTDFLVNIAGGDARTALNAIELSLRLADKSGDKVLITRDLTEKAIQQKYARYDKKGDNHYDNISAFIKSMRGSDPDAALLWLSKMLEAGEDPKFIARRMVIFASEDVGNADSMALVIAVSVFRAVEIIGLPEAAINIAQGVTYLASCEKSNASYNALMSSTAEMKESPVATVPLYLRNAPTRLMKQEGYGKEYKYPHDYPDAMVDVKYFPEEFEVKSYYKPGDKGREAEFAKRLRRFWKNRY